MTYDPHLSLSFYATLCLACTVAVYFLPIETKGRALQVRFTLPVHELFQILFLVIHCHSNVVLRKKIPSTFMQRIINVLDCSG